MSATGHINASAYGLWRHAEGVPVEVIEDFGRTCRVKLLADFVHEGRVAHKAGSVALVLRDWVTVDGGAS